MANFVDGWGSWLRAREYRRDRERELAERTVAAQERIAAALEKAGASDPSTVRGTND